MVINMKLTAEEKLMYEVMKAIYESGIPLDFKGSMVLKACLHEAGYEDDVRHTVDIDGNWYSDAPLTKEQMTESLQKALDKNNIALNVINYRMYAEGRSAGFELRDKSSDEILFTMDIDVNRPKTPNKIYEIEGFRFCGIAVSQMFADKVSAISSDKVFRRIKDVIDLYYLSKVFKIDRKIVLQTLRKSGRKLENFDAFLHREDELRHSYEKFRFEGEVGKPSFDDVYSTVKMYIKDIIPKQRNRDLER